MATTSLNSIQANLSVESAPVASWMRRSQGFTLIELMIVVAVVAILASVAYPGYKSQIQKTRRADAEGALMGLAGAMERHFTEKNSYQGAAGSSASPTDSGAPWIFADKSPIDGSTKYYNLTISNATDSGYTLQAAPIGAQANDPCGNLTLSNTGLRGAAASNCW